VKKAVAIIVALLFVFAVASFALAAEEKKAAPAPVEKKAEEKKVEKKAVPKQVTGEIKAIDKEKKTVTVTKKVKDKVTETVVAADDKTKIMEGKDKKSFADLKVGDKVKVVYEEKDGKNIANSITILKVEKKVEKKAEPAKPAEKKAEPAKPAEKK